MSFDALPDRQTQRVLPERCRLHSLSFLLLARVFAILLGIGIYQVVATAIEAAPELGLVRVIGEGTLYVAILLGLVYILWFRKKVVATRAGLEVGRGKRRCVIPWPQVLEVRELPWIRFNPPWYPKMWQVDLLRGKSFDFIGVRDCQEIVAAFIERAPP